MFDIPELDNMVCLQLPRHALARCAQVNKMWHRVFIPYIWQNLLYDERSFRRMVVYDYLEVQERHQQEGAFQEQQSPPLSLLSRYGAYIRHVRSDPYDPLDYLISSLSILSGEQTNNPTDMDLICHLLKHCANLGIPRLCLRDYHFKSDHLIKTFADHILPRVISLTLSAFEVEPWRLSADSMFKQFGRADLQ